MTPNSNENISEENDTSNGSNSYKLLHPVFTDMIQQIKNKDQLERAMYTLQKLSFEFKGEAMPLNLFPVGHTTMLGEVNGSRRKEKRLKFAYEKN